MKFRTYVLLLAALDEKYRNFEKIRLHHYDTALGYIEALRDIVARDESVGVNELRQIIVTSENLLKYLWEKAMEDEKI